MSFCVDNQFFGGAEKYQEGPSKNCHWGFWSQRFVMTIDGAGYYLILWDSGLKSHEKDMQRFTSAYS